MLDSVYGLHFDKKDKTRVIRMQSGEGEIVPMSETINCQATGNVEDWLGGIVMAMRMTIKDITRNAASDYSVLSLEDFIIKYPAQIALLGIQFLWTDDSESSLLRSKTEKGVMNQSARPAQLAGRVLAASLQRALLNRQRSIPGRYRAAVRALSFTEQPV